MARLVARGRVFFTVYGSRIWRIQEIRGTIGTARREHTSGTRSDAHDLEMEARPRRTLGTRGIISCTNIDLLASRAVSQEMSSRVYESMHVWPGFLQYDIICLQRSEQRFLLRCFFRVHAGAWATRWAHEKLSVG